MWSALFEILKSEDKAMGSLAETAIFSQWFHHPRDRFYARWSDGEVDIVGLGPNQKAAWAIEVKWTDRFVENPSELKSLISFCGANKLSEAVVTTLTAFKEMDYCGIKLRFVPTSIYCWTVGHNLVKGRQDSGS